MKKFVALMVALVLVFAMGMSTFATETTGSITIASPVDGESYSIYLMFDLESYDEENGTYAYKITEDWREFVESGAGSEYFTIDDNDYIVVNDGVDDEDGADIAKAALEYAAEKELEPVAVLPNNGSYTATGLALGYYLVDSSLGSLCGLDTTAPDATIVEKNEKPSLVKEVLEDTNHNGAADAGETWGDENDANIGDTVIFRITVIAKSGATGYVVTDVMEDGLSFEAISSVSAGEVVLTETEDYTVATNDDGFTLSFTEDYLSTIAQDTDIVIEYTAVLNSNAVVYTDKNNNKAQLAYGDSSSSTTAWDETNTLTYAFSVLKYANGDVTKVLSGAGFTLYADANCTQAISFTSTSNGYRVDSNGTVSEIFTDDNGSIKYFGLDSGIYYLKETTTPDGYNKLDTAVTVTIGSDGTVDGYTNNVVTVENMSGTLLPSTGGIGTTIFYIVGGLLVVFAVVVLISKKRMSREAD